MPIKLPVLVAALFFGVSAFATAGPKVLIKTNQGDITIELNEEKAPETVKNFLSYVNEGFFNGTVFHRIIPGFMIQGGGFELKEDGSIEQKLTKAPIQNECKNGLKNTRGTVAMARTKEPHTASAQFFINHGDNDNLDYVSGGDWAYAVFGEVVAGLDVVDKIAKLPTTTKVLRARAGDITEEAEMDDVPEEAVVIKSAKVTVE